MIEAFFGSKARAIILKIFLLNPESNYYLRQLSRDLGLQLNSVRRELKLLLKMGVIHEVKSDAPGREVKAYQADKNFILFSELQALMSKAQILAAHNFFAELKKVAAVKLFILSGVFSGNFNSPTDLLIVYKGTKAKFLTLLKKLETEIGQELRYTLMDEAELAYRFKIADSFVYNIIRGEKIILTNELELGIPKQEKYEDS